jgi:hypothetical protein
MKSTEIKRLNQLGKLMQKYGLIEYTSADGTSIKMCTSEFVHKSNLPQSNLRSVKSPFGPGASYP